MLRYEVVPAALILTRLGMLNSEGSSYVGIRCCWGFGRRVEQDGVAHWRKMLTRNNDGVSTHFTTALVTDGN